MTDTHRSRTLRLFLLLACLVLVSGMASASISFAVCGTGFTNATCTNQVTPGGTDGNWTLVSAPPVTDCTNGPCTAPTTGVLAPVTTTGDFPSAWIADDSTSEWISPRNNETGDSDPDSAVTPYVYTETFVIPATVNPSTVIITGGWSVDNYGSILVNGNAVSTGVDGALGSGTTGAFGIVTSFVLDGSAVGSENAPSLHVGSNTLTFDVFNNANGSPDVTGLNVVIDSALGQASAPEPAAIAFTTLGLAALGLLGRRKRSV
jgi:hypothetical protein